MGISPLHRSVIGNYFSEFRVRQVREFLWRRETIRLRVIFWGRKALGGFFRGKLRRQFRWRRAEFRR
jgi:hypothetical protein